MKKLLLFLALPVAAFAVNRSITISAPSTVTAGQSFTVPTSASTDANDGEQLGFYHAEYSTNGGSSWTGFCYDVNAGTSATRNAYITAGGAGSTVVVRVKIAFRGGSAGDVDYNGGAINWSGSWDAWQTPPTAYAYISVVAPPNNPPTITWVQTPFSAYINQWFAVQSRGNDADGNLTNVFVWKEWVPFAFNGGGNGYESYSDANMTYGTSPATIIFQTQSQDSNNATSEVKYHGIYIANRDPSVSVQLLDGSKNALPINGSGRAQTGQNATFYIRVTGTDPDGNLSQLYSRINRPDGTAFAHEQVAAAMTSTVMDFGPYNTGNAYGVWDVWAHATDATAGAYQWQGNGWWGTHSPDLEVTNQAPSGTFTINGSASNATVAFGQTVSIASSVTDVDGNLIVHSFWWDQGSGLAWTHPVRTWGDYPPNADGWLNLNLGANGYDASGSSSNRSFDFRATHVATYAFHNAASDPQSWVGVGATTLYVTVNKATPTGTFTSRTLGTGSGSYTVQAGDLNATFANPYSGGVTAPTGAPSYSLVAGGSGSVTAGTVLAAGTYTVRASYPGDTNYNATTVDATWTIAADTTPPSVPGSLAASAITTTGFTLSWSASTDNVGVTAYEVFKNGASQGTMGSTSLNLSGLTQNTVYTMTVRARDAAGNWSAQSSALNVTTGQDPAADNDGDGLSNAEEAALGTDPDSAAGSGNLNLNVHRPKP